MVYRYKKSGWRNESVRHGLASKGIKTTSKNTSYKVIGAEGIPLKDPRLYKFGSVAWQESMEHNIKQKVKHKEELSGMERVFLDTQKEKYNVLGAKGEKPSLKEIREYMELHNNDEVGIDSQWTMEDAEYHLLLDDKYYYKNLGAEGRYTAREIIKKSIGDSRNFLTPDLIRYGKVSPSIAYELSSGYGMEAGTILYGVTVSSIDRKTGKTKREYDISKSFHSREEAEEYIKGLKNE